MTISELIEMSVGELREFLAYADSDAKLLDLMEDSEWSDEDAEHEDAELDPEVQGICEDIVADIEMGRSDLDSIERTVIDNYGIEAYNYIVAHIED